MASTVAKQYRVSGPQARLSVSCQNEPLTVKRVSWMMKIEKRGTYYCLASLFPIYLNAVSRSDFTVFPFRFLQKVRGTHRKLLTVYFILSIDLNHWIRINDRDVKNRKKLGRL